MILFILQIDLIKSIGDTPKTKKQKLSHNMSVISRTWTHTLLQIDKFSHIWSIDNFNYFCTHAKQEFPTIMSTDFTGPNNDCEFYLELCPKGGQNESKDFVSLYLFTIQKGISAVFSFSLIDNNGKSTRFSSKFYANESGYLFNFKLNLFHKF